MAVSLLAGARPPYVEFIEKTFEDRAATEKNGAYTARSEDYVIVRQIGSKDTFEKNATEWLAGLSRDPNMAPEWANHFKAQFAAWKSGQEITPDGIHVKTWPLISRSQAETLIRANLRTVEDLARAPEAALMAVGIGARELQHKAQAWLDSAANTGRQSEEVVNLRAKTSAQDETIKGLRDALNQMEVRFEKRMAGLKPAVAEEDFLAPPKGG